MKYGRVVLVFVVAMLIGWAHPATAQETVMTWKIDGVQRTALVFAPVPTTAAAEQHPLIFAFHGHGGTSEKAAQSMHLQTLWPEAIVVYPQGLNTRSHVDPQGNFPGWQVRAGQAGLGDRDLKLFDAMLATLRQKFPIDNTRIYATGFSNGAMFGLLLWAERGKGIAAFAVGGGRLDPSEHLSLPRAAMIFGGRPIRSCLSPTNRRRLRAPAMPTTRPHPASLADPFAHSTLQPPTRRW
jgi:polyhydroxybutyrate depolymerase